MRPSEPRWARAAARCAGRASMPTRWWSNWIQSMRPAWRATAASNRVPIALVAVVMASWLIDSAHAQQWLQPPPALQQPTYAAQLIEQLDGEVASALPSMRAADQNRQPFLRASINCRKVA